MLGQAIGDLLPSAVGVALSPVPIVAVILMLATPRGRDNGIAFAVGWVVGLVAVNVVVLLLAGGADDPKGETSTTVDVLKIVLGIVLVRLTVDNWNKRPQPGQAPEMPKWMGAIQDFDTTRSALTGAALAAVNPKNLILTAAGAATIAQAGLSAGGDVVAVLVFVLVGSASIVVPVAAYLALGDKARDALATAQSWMAQNNAVIMMVVCLVLAAKLLGNGIGGLTD